MNPLTIAILLAVREWLGSGPRTGDDGAAGVASR